MVISNTGKKWTTEDDNTLVYKYLQGYGYQAIADDLQRTIDAVQCRLVKVYVYPLVRKLFYTDKNTFNKSSLVGYDNIILRYSTFYKIKADDFSRFLRYVDKNIKPPSVTDKQTVLNVPINTQYEDEFLKTLEGADEYKLKYYKYKYLYRLEIINNMLK
jgi:hypothetical protein